ncbi:hypothetical protein AHF37_12831, partial [Paragonimus kellicotti]
MESRIVIVFYYLIFKIFQCICGNSTKGRGLSQMFPSSSFYRVVHVLPNRWFAT